MSSCPPLGVTSRAYVRRVIDGDTVDVELVTPMRIRLLDCWAPELHGELKHAGEASKAKLESLLQPGDMVQVHVPTQDAKKLGDAFSFGRVLGSIWRKLSGDRVDHVSVSQRMVNSGHATAEKA